MHLQKKKKNKKEKEKKKKQIYRQTVNVHRFNDSPSFFALYGVTVLRLD